MENLYRQVVKLCLLRHNVDEISLLISNAIHFGTGKYIELRAHGQSINLHLWSNIGNIPWSLSTQQDLLAAC